MTPVVAAHPLSLNSPYAALSLSQAVFTSVDSGTLAGYRSSSDKYERWCRVRRLSPWPTDEVLLAAWCVHLGVIHLAGTCDIDRRCDRLTPVCCSQQLV